MSKEMMCQRCHRNIVSYRVTEDGTPFYAGVSETKRAQRILMVCEQCAASVPPNAREKLFLG